MQRSNLKSCPSTRGKAPAAPPAQLPRGKGTIRSTVSLVEIDVQVTDRNGKPIKGLKQEQFSVTEDGKAQKVSTFEYNDIEQIETAGTASEGRRSRFRWEPCLHPKKSRRSCTITG